jgi:S-adenosylmethionine:tRNA ribosyltransferase-isomerase
VPPPDPAELDYALPPERIAQEPLPERDAARMLVLDRASGARHHATIRELPDWLEAGDLLVVNATRVEPARLRGRKASGGAAEALLLGAADGPRCWRALVRARGRLRAGQKLHFVRSDRALEAEIVAVDAGGVVTLAFGPGPEPHALGEMPLPPYIRRPAPDPRDHERYQTVFAREPGSVAAPTAGLHLTPRLLGALEARGVERAEVVLHVGAGTFRPLRPEDLARGTLHAERYALPEATAASVARTRARGGRVVAVGTTTTRVLETCAQGGGLVRAGAGETRLFLKPGDDFRVVDALLTNFHLPRSSLLLLVAAFAGREATLDAYRDAIARGYRFYSYGDAMLVR